MTSSSNPSPQGPLALLVDDSRTMRSIQRSFLSQLGFRTLEAVDGLDALENLDAYPEIELVLLDWNMPKMNGIDCLETFRQRLDRRETKIMMVTTEIEASQIMKAMQAGADEYLMKPFTLADLIAKLSLLGFETDTGM